VKAGIHNAEPLEDTHCVNRQLDRVHAGEDQIAGFTFGKGIDTGAKPRLLTIRAAAALLGLSIWTLRSWAYSGQIGSHSVVPHLECFEGLPQLVGP
jgi:hypothetical protein